MSGGGGGGEGGPGGLSGARGQFPGVEVCRRSARRRPGAPARSQEAGSGCHSFSLVTCGAGEPVRDGPRR